MSSATLTTSHRDTVFSGWLDLFRALAAFAVLFGHARTLFLESATGIEPVPVKVLYLLSGYGHLAVMVFFVLSGYLVGGSVIRSVRDERWSWSDYLLRRGTRLYIVLIPALLLTLCWDYGEETQSSGLTPNNDTAVAIIRSETIRAHTSLAIFVGNAIFLQNVIVSSLGSNTPLWSLTNEFWYYLVFPLIWLAVKAPGLSLFGRVTHVAVAGLILCLLGKSISLYFLVWLLGAVVAILPETTTFQSSGLHRLCVILAVATVLGVLSAVPTFAQHLPQVAQDAIVAVVFANLLYCLKHDHRPVMSQGFRRVVGFFAAYSYTVYLVHLPPLIFLRACLTYEAAWPPISSSWLKLAGIIACVMGYAYILSLITEHKTESVRRWISDQFRGSKRQPPQFTPGSVAT